MTEPVRNAFAQIDAWKKVLGEFATLSELHRKMLLVEEVAENIRDTLEAYDLPHSVGFEEGPLAVVIRLPLPRELPRPVADPSDAGDAP